jgi:Na+/H+ antiporter NhaC
MASACDHIDHVRTQLPYAVLVALVAMAVGDIPTSFGLPPWVSLLIGLAILYGVLRIFGKRVDERGHAGFAPADAVAASVGPPGEPA